MEGGPPIFRQDGSCPALLEDLCAGFPYGAVTRSGPPFQTLPVPNTNATGLVRVRSPLLTESRLMSFPPATEMFQFAGFASCAYGFSAGYPLRGGLPHSEIPGSTIARISPGLFAACYVLHRLSVPRHPPDALLSRLSATPNGKNQIPIAQNRSAADAGKPLLSEDTLCRRSHRRHDLPAATRPDLPPRSHNSFLHLQSTYPPPAVKRPSGDKSLCRRNGVTPELPRSMLVPWGCLVEVNGIEPMTSCLQSRRSPN